MALGINEKENLLSVEKRLQNISKMSAYELLITLGELQYGNQ